MQKQFTFIINVKGIKMKKMPDMCPISGKGCKNCPLYRGRHFTHSFQAHYKEYIDNCNKELESAKYGWAKLDK